MGDNTLNESSTESESESELALSETETETETETEDGTSILTVSSSDERDEGVEAEYLLSCTLEPSVTPPALNIKLRLDAISTTNNTILEIKAEDKPFFNLFRADDLEELIQVFKTQLPFKIEDKQYRPAFHSIIKGSFAKYYFSNAILNFTPEELPVFISFIDLITREKVSLNVEDLVAELQYQEQNYGLRLTKEQLKSLQDLLVKHPINEQSLHLEYYKESLSNPTWSDLIDKASNLIREIVRQINGDEVNEASHVKAELTSAPEDREVVIARLRADNYPSTEDMKEDLRLLFTLRRNFKPDAAYYYQHVAQSRKAFDFWNSTYSADNWSDPERNKEARKLFIESALQTDTVLAHLGWLLKEAGQEPDIINVSALLADKKFLFYGSFLEEGIIDFYQKYRQKSFTLHLNINGEPNRIWSGTDANKEFFAKGSPENDIRELYNTFIKYGFLEFYKQRPGYTQNLQGALNSQDSQFKYAQKDKKSSGPSSGFFCPRQKKEEEEWTYTHPSAKRGPSSF